MSEVAAQLSSKLAQDAHAAKIAFREEAMVRLADARWFEAKGDVANGVSDRARYADLVVIGQDEWQGSPETHPLPIAHTVAVRCGRPVLVVPAAVQLTHLASAAVAWDGGRESVRAIHDALPLLRLARLVQIITITSPSAEDSEGDAESLLEHLTRHAVAIGSDVVRIKSTEEHASLREHIENGPYDWLVMGAYSHPIWMEFIFGGVTQSILLSSKIPVLVSH
nr:universal stress protein [Burkholderia thailandensis]